MKITSLQDLYVTAQEYKAALAQYEKHVTVCGGGGCVSSGCMAAQAAVLEGIKQAGLENKVGVTLTGCMGLCSQGPLLLVEPEGVLYVKVTPLMVEDIVRRHLKKGEVAEEFTYFDAKLQQHIPLINDIPFISEQVRIALRNCGKADFAAIESYIALDGFQALHDALNMRREDVIAQVKLSGLRGRGGGGFPTGRKWEAGFNAPGDQKYIVCNADEGDPGAFMDRALIESDPFALIEGMMIGAYAIGAAMGYVYIRAEYPIAVERLKGAIAAAKEWGLLGEKILGTDFSFELEIRIGAGACVCGEETALMHSVEGERGEPSQKPPFPFERGLFGCPTIINNVETFANIPAILKHGGAWFAAWGIGESRGTKVFALAGDIVNSGLADVPMGYPLGDLIYKVGAGISGNRKFKAAQIGGPSGGCITKENLNTPVAYESLARLGAIMGSGGLVVMSNATCMVDTARFFMDFICDESCGKCVPCRIGTKRMLEILEKITKGEGQEEDLLLVRELSETIGETAMCGLGQTAPNPVLSTLRWFGREYEDHIREHHCEAGICRSMFQSPCQNACPADVDVAGFLTLIQNGRTMDAYNLIRHENPFPAVCGRVCTHPCEDKCARSQRDVSVAICDLERFVSDYALNHTGHFVDDIRYPRNNKKVAIIGAGPSGLTCAYYLARLGYSVDVYESKPQAGGTLAYGVPEFRLPEDILQHEIKLIQEEGVVIHLNTQIGKDTAFEQLKENADAIYVSTGAPLRNDLGLEGENLKGVYYGLPLLQDLRAGRRVRVGKNVLVIGGGTTAMDAARSALRLGAQQVTVLYRREKEDMPASRLEVAEALEEGVRILTLTGSVRILGDDKGRVTGVLCQKMTPGKYDNEGRPTAEPVENSEFTIPADMVIPAVSQHADYPFAGGGEKQDAWEGVEVSRHSLMTNVDGIFAGGDLTRGSDTAIAAIADGKRAAANIDKYLGGEGILNKGRPIDVPSSSADEDSTEYGRFPLEKLSPSVRVQGFREVNKGYRKLYAVAEATRCLGCDRR